MKALQSVLVMVPVFVVGAAAGYVFGNRHDTAELRAAQARIGMLESRPANSRPSIEARREPLAERPARASAPTAEADAATNRADFSALDRLRVLADLQERNLVKPVLTFLDRKGRLDASFVNLFALTPGEQARLQHSIDDVRDKLANLERTNAKVTRDDRGNVVVDIQAFPSEGGKIYDEMMQGFADILGPERNDAYRRIGAEQVEMAFGRFGAAERTYTFGYDPTERPGQPYTFQDKVVQRGPNGGYSGNTNSTRFQSFDDLAARVGPIISILPPDYGRPK